MHRWKLYLAGLLLGMLVLSGCAAQLEQADRDLLNRALESVQMVGQQADKAQAAADMASNAAAQAKNAAVRAQTSAADAEKSAGMASQDANAAAASAVKAAKALDEIGQIK